MSADDIGVGVADDRPDDPGSKGKPVLFVWFIVWLIANNVGGNEPLVLDPVNAWTGTLILAAALDLSASHALPRSSR